MGWKRELDSIDDLVHRAPSVPLTDQAMVRADAARSALAALCAVLPHGPASEQQPGPEGLGNMTSNVDLLEEVLTGAPAIPLTDRVRVDRERTYDLIDRLRALIPGEALLEQLAEVDPSKAEGLKHLITSTFRTQSELREQVLGERIVNPSLRVEVDVTTVLGLIDRLQSLLLRLETAKRSAGLTTSGRREATDALERIASAVRAGDDRSGSTTARLSRRKTAALFDELGMRLDEMVYPEHRDGIGTGS